MHYIFGPAQSNRLGRSLGIDLIPHKICNYDCVYCECGRTTSKIARRASFIRLEKLVQELRNTLSIRGEDDFDVITITGSGEPTLELQLAAVIQEIRIETSKPVAVLTNGSLFPDPQVREALSHADMVLPSLDAAGQRIYEKVDQPLSGYAIDEIISGMIAFRRDYPHVLFRLEVLIVEGVNDGDDEIPRIRSAIETIQPHSVDVCTVTRPPAYTGVRPVDPVRLERIRTVLAAPLCAAAAQPAAQAAAKAVQLEDPQSVFDLLKRRPCRPEDLMMAFAGDGDFLQRCLDEWVDEGKICRIVYNGGVYYGFRAKTS